MRIVHVVEPFATGINTFINELVIGLSEHEHVIIHGERFDNRALTTIKSEYPDSVSFVKWEYAQREIRLMHDIKAYRALKKQLKKIDYDVVHLHSSKAGCIGGVWALFRREKRVVYTPNAASFMRTDISRMKKWLFGRIEKIVSNFGARIVASSNSEQAAYEQLGIDTRVVKNGVTINTEKWRETRTDKSIVNVVFCGKVTMQKNPALFNEIAEAFIDRKNVRFIWIGDGEMKEHLTSQNITITGWCNKDEVFEYLANGDIYLSASLWEGLPFSCIEAMAFGLPLIVHNCRGNVDLVEEGINGHVFESAEQAVAQLNQLIQSREVLESYADNAKKYYGEEFGNYKCARDYEQVYTAVQ